MTNIIAVANQKGGGGLSRIDEGGVAHWPAKRES